MKKSSHLGKKSSKSHQKKVRRKTNFHCEACDYFTQLKGDYTKHCKTKKHLKKSSQIAKKVITKPKKSSQNSIKIPIISSELEKLKMENEVLKEKHKAELKAQEQNLTIKHLKEKVKIYEKYEGKAGTSNSHNTTNSHNTNNISINMYINEHCKDAMNLDDFVNKIKFKLKDVFDGSLPIQNSVQKVFLKNLEDLDPTKRPVHCTDSRRGKFLVNDKNEGWVQDDGEKIASSVQKVQQKAIVESYDAFDAEYTPPHPGRIQDKKDSIINPLRDNREKARPKIVKEVANVVNIKDAINQLETEVKDID